MGVGQAQQLEALRQERDGLDSRVLLHDGDVSDARLTVTWVDLDVAPGSGQCAHSYAPEHVYVVVKGWGTMWAGGEERLVVEGDVVFIHPTPSTAARTPRTRFSPTSRRPPPQSTGGRSMTRVR